MEKEIASGVEPNKIAFLSFTKKAAAEATARACERFNLSKSDLIYFRTIHSMAFLALQIKKTCVMQLSDYKKIGEHLGITFGSKAGDGAEDGWGESKHAGNHYDFIVGFSRARHLPPSKVWDMVEHEGLNWYEFRRYQNTLAQYKKERGLYDFSDMLERGVRPVDVEVVIIDEAQDLSTAQWYFITNMFKTAKRMYVGGDDDQAIFEWSGADINYFITMSGERTVLNHSFRIPKSVHTVASNISAKIKDRAEKVYCSRDVVGQVVHWRDVADIDFSSGSWLLLARNTYLMDELVTVVKNKGHNFLYKGKKSIDQADINAILLWEKARSKGYELSVDDKVLLDNYTSKLTSKRIWHEAFDRLSVIKREYYISLLRRGEALTREPRINISTIHSAKGGEADNVVMLTDMTQATFEAATRKPDSEHRVWYVGATRAKESLHIVMPIGRYNYTI